MLTPDQDALIERAARRFGWQKLQLVVRLVEWFEAQTLPVQRWVAGLHDRDQAEVDRILKAIGEAIASRDEK